MAQAAKVKDLTNDLVHSITGRTQDDTSFTQLRDPAFKTLQNASRSRTNQFDVESKLNGLVEKFSVLNRDDLAETLQQGLDELLKESKWLPEILSLFLLLSDRPLEKTSIDQLDDSTQQDIAEAALTWADILADDPLEEADIWDDVDRGYHSSGDDAIVDGEEDSDLTTSTHATSVGEDDSLTIARRHILYPNEDAVKEVEAAHDYLNQEIDQVGISELTFVRETLSMLHGLPTTIYDLQQPTGLVKLNQKFYLQTASRTVFRDTLIHFADIASSLNMLRTWIRSEEEVTFLRSCQASVRSFLMRLSSQLAEIEHRYHQLKVETVVSLMTVRSEVDRISRPLIHLSGLVLEFRKRDEATPWALLDRLYDEACLAQMSGDTDFVSMLAGVFFPALKTYLKPVSTWIRSGTLDAQNETFFIVESNSGYALESMWRDRFSIRELRNGAACVPRFLYTIADQIYALGKTRAFLRALNGDEAMADDEVQAALPDFDGVQDQLSQDNLVPFSQLCDDFLSSWVTQTSKDCTPLLCQRLLYDQGLLSTLDTLHYACCSKDGRIFQTFAETLFWRMDFGRDAWKDSFLLTELAQSTVGSHDVDLAANVTIQSQENDSSDAHVTSIRQLAAINMEFAFSWPLQNITAYNSPPAYSKAFTLLLQVYRAKYLLRPRLFDLRSLDCRTESMSYAVQAGLKLKLFLLSVVNILHDHITGTSQSLENAVRHAVEKADGIDAMAAVWADHHKRMETSLLLSDSLKPVREAVIDILESCERFTRTWNGIVDGRSIPPVDKGAEVDGPVSDRLQTPSAEFSPANLNSLRKQLGRSISFLEAGLRGISRAGGNTALESLAERLQWLVH